MPKIIQISRENVTLSAAIFETTQPKVCVQIIHGAKEHKERYFNFAEYLAEHGIAVVISDNRGHGASLNKRYPLGHMENWQEIVEDQHAVTQMIKTQFPQAKLCLLGHSLGSVFARCYLQKYDHEIDWLVLSGTANYIEAVEKGRKLAKLITKLSGSQNHNKTLVKLGDGNEDDSWVCANPDTMEEYRNDPLCTGYTYTNGAILTIWEADYQLHQFQNYQCKNPNLSILSISGMDDPVTGGREGLQDSDESLRRIGYRGMQNLVYPGMKHEVLNEVERVKVYKDVLKFLSLS